MYRLLTCVAGFTGALVAINLVDTGPIVTGIALAVVNVDFTVDSCQKIAFSILRFEKRVLFASSICMCVAITCGAFEAAADIGVLFVLAGASVLARLTQTLVDIGLTQPAGVSRVAVAAEGGQTVDASAIVARVRVTLVDVRLTVPPRVT